MPETIATMAKKIILMVKNNRAITGMVKDRVISRQISLQKLADFGVPEDITLPYETDELRKLVQELAQIEVY